jgi:hypothetical protein
MAPRASAATNGKVPKSDAEKLSDYMATTLRLAQQLARMKQPALSRDMIRIAAGIGAAVEEI